MLLQTSKPSLLDVFSQALDNIFDCINCSEYQGHYYILATSAKEISTSRP